MLIYNPLLLIIFSCNIHPILCKQKLCLTENTIEIVFSAGHSFCGSQIVKTPLEAPSKNTIFKPNVRFQFSLVPAETNPHISLVFL